MKMYGGADVQIHIFLTLVLIGGKWSVSRTAALPPEKEPPPLGIHCKSGRVGPEAGMDDVEKRKLLIIGTRTPTPRPSKPIAAFTSY
jgi:hypothetical protein